MNSPVLSRRQTLALALSTPALPSWAATDKNTLNIAAPWEINSLEPSRAGYVFSRLQVTETLVEVDTDGALAPGLAAAWEVSANQRLWRFTLRADARFHDGSPVSAAHVVLVLQRAHKAPGVLGATPLQKISADGNAVLLELARPFTALPAFLAHTSTQILAPEAYAADGSVQAVIGSGPYKISRLEAPQKVQLERFDGWQGPRPAIARVSYLAVGRGETRNLLATSGQADLVFTHDPPNFVRLQANKTLQFHTLPIPRTLYIKVNAGHPFLKDVQVRRALSLAIDRAGIASAVLREPRAAATQLFPPGLGEWHVAGLQPLVRDLPQARALLQAAGWTPGPDGMLQRQGQAFKLTLRTFPDRPELPVVATALQAQLKTIGIDVAVTVGNSSEIPAGHQDGSLELALLARNYGLVPDPLGTLLQDFGQNGGDWGAMGWNSALVRESLQTLSSTADAARRSAQRGAIATVLQAELPVIPIAWYQHTATSSKRLSRVVIDPLERSYRIDQMVWA
nr:ABC transporter substrate-binding protein [uncultured Albidiferax sp.]